MEATRGGWRLQGRKRKDGFMARGLSSPREITVALDK
jgi:hypothetical protein